MSAEWTKFHFLQIFRANCLEIFSRFLLVGMVVSGIKSYIIYKVIIYKVMEKMKRKTTKTFEL